MFLSAIAVEKTGYSGSAAEKRPVDHIRGQIEMSHIFFRYDENTPYVLNDLSLSIKAGEYVAIVGRTGCEKSTLVRLMLGFEKPEKVRFIMTFRIWPVWIPVPCVSTSA